MNSKEKIDGERSLGEQEKGIRPRQRRVLPKWRDAFRRWRIDGSVSEEGVAIAPAVGSQNPAIAQWRQTEEYG
jgi:hypothetical protein